LLKNCMIPGTYEGSPLQAVNRANLVLKKGAARVMGGGLVGSIICYVPPEEYDSFIEKMSQYYEKSSIVEVSIPRFGAHEVK
ncbi:MAG: hypothetical protein K5694_01405, partial [Bacilli bacterium]|nr:hypothetical protein [Bacilli bacterium]